MILQSKEATIEAAIARLRDVKPATLGNKERAVCAAVQEALSDFCRQEAEFAQAVLDNDGGFGDCLREVVKNTGSCLSDVEAYRRAVHYYFPGAEVRVTMRVDLVGKAADLQSAEKTAEPAGALNLSLDDLFS